MTLGETEKQNLTWTTLTTESTGLANLSRVQGSHKGHNTAFAKITLVSETDQVKPMKFGFSDKVKVYCNDQLLFSGADMAYSRDYRFLGTIGFYDELYLPLKAGENEIWMGVSEMYGGWAIQAQFGNMEGISVK